MSTRATYQFNTTRTTLYVHYDGYPEGAAEKFKAAIECENRRGTLMEKFLRTEENAEWTEGHGAHGDTEWRYTIDGDGAEATLTVWERQAWNDREDDFVRVSSGWLSLWLESTLGEPFLQVGGVLKTVSMMFMEIDDGLRYIEVCNEKGWNGNALSTANEVWRKLDLLTSARISPLDAHRAEIARIDFLRMTSDFAEKFGWPEKGLTQEDWNDRFYVGWRGGMGHRASAEAV